MDKAAKTGYAEYICLDFRMTIIYNKTKKDSRRIMF